MKNIIIITEQELKDILKVLKSFLKDYANGKLYSYGLYLKANELIESLEGAKVKELKGVKVNES